MMSANWCLILSLCIVGVSWYAMQSGLSKHVSENSSGADEPSAQLTEQASDTKRFTLFLSKRTNKGLLFAFCCHFALSLLIFAGELQIFRDEELEVMFLSIGSVILGGAHQLDRTSVLTYQTLMCAAKRIVGREQANTALLGTC